MTTSLRHVAVPGSERRLRHGARAVGPANPDEGVTVTVKLRRAKALPPLAGRPKTPLSREAFAKEYGATSADIKAVSSTLASLGLEVLSEDPATRTVRAAGPVSAMEAAFAVRLVQYQLGAEHYRGRVGPAHVPRDLADIVVGVFGLDNRRMVTHRHERPRNTPCALSAIQAKARSWFKPSELAHIYGFPPGDGAGESIGLIEFGGGYFPDDLAKFCEAVGAPAGAKVIPVSVDHTPTTTDDDFAGEVMLDVEIVAALCPKATIPVYFAHWSEHGWIDILDAAIHDTKNKPTILSVSYGLPEAFETWTRQALDQVDQALQEAAHLGVTVCVASGDDGTDAQVGDGLAHVNFPASSPYVLSVGGTNLSAPDRKTRKSETVWMQGDGKRADRGGSTGGGVSSHFALPQWQEAVAVPSVNPHAAPGRCVPDVAALANFSGYLLVVGGQAQPNGGTSAAAPLWASLLGRVNAALVAAGKPRVGYVTPVLYSAGTHAGRTLGQDACFDVTSGNNDTAAAVEGYAARSGYDCVTGWGSPKGVELLAALKKLL